MTNAVASEKSDLRRAMRVQRASLDATARAEAARAVSSWQPMRPASIVSAFFSIGDEIDTAPLMHALHAAGHRLCLPVMMGRDRPLTLRTYVPGDTLAIVQWGIREPGTDKPAVDPDVLIMPLLAVDRTGHRLGYGGGYYDRTLKRLRAIKPVLALGLAYDNQVIDAVPHLDYDERIDAVLTPTRYRTFPF